MRAIKFCVPQLGTKTVMGANCSLRNNFSRGEDVKIIDFSFKSTGEQENCQPVIPCNLIETGVLKSLVSKLNQD